MSKQLKLIIPLLDNEITKDDISEEAGFVDAYTYDMNRPYLDNHIFLLYVANLSVTKSYNRTIKFSKLKSICNIADVRIKGVLCKVYAFCIINTVIKNILKNPFMIDKSNKLRILKFWNTEDNDINEYFIDNDNVEYDALKITSIPEWDYENLYVRIQKGESGTCCA